MDILMSVSPNNQRREAAMKQFYQYYKAIASPKSKIKVNKLHHFLKIDMTEIYFLTEDEYEIWCKGRTYIFKGKIYHSGYPIKGDSKHEFTEQQKLKGLSLDVTFIDEFVTKEVN